MMNEEYQKNEIEEWKRSMLELPDELFFSIMRIYLGEIRTPFHKPALVDRLSSFLSHHKTIQRITALTDEKDTVFLTAVNILERPHISDLYALFEEETDYFSFHGRLRNLQERLLVYHRHSDDTIALNPLLEPSLRTYVLDPSLLFEFREIEKPRKPENGGKQGEDRIKPLISETLLWALICSLFTDDNILKADGTLKKKSKNKLEHLFFGYEVKGGPEFIIRCAVQLGLLEPRESRLVPKQHLIDKFAGLTKKREQQQYGPPRASVFPQKDRGNRKSLYPPNLFRRWNSRGVRIFSSPFWRPCRTPQFLHWLEFVGLFG
ncbi:MAG: hypothetical protein ACOC2B_07875 [Sediminispirochaetaceae bacterium]